MILGITGGSGCGKTTALQAVRAMGGLVLDCDEIYHRLLVQDKALISAIDNRFPGVVEDGTLNRKMLGSLVFSDPNALLDLNRITHGAVKAEVQRELDRMQERGYTLAAIDAIALYESGLADLCHYTIAVIAPAELRVERLMAREGISREYALSRIRAQKSNGEFSRLADITLTNEGGQEEFYQAAHNMIRVLTHAHEQNLMK